MASKFQRFQNVYNVLGKRLVPNYQMSIACFLEDVDLIFKVSKNSLDGSLDLIRCASFPTFPKRNRENDVPEDMFSEMIWDCS